MLQLLQTIDESNQKLEERLKKQHITSKERTHKMLRELRLGWAPAATHTSINHFSTLTIDSREFSGEPEDRKTLSRVHQTHPGTAWCVDPLMAEGDEDIKIGISDFDYNDYETEEYESEVYELEESEPEESEIQALI